MVTERPQTDLDPWKDEDERKRHDRRSRRIALAIVTAVVIIAAVAGGALLRDQPARQTSASASVQTTASTHVTAPALQEGVYLVSIDDGSFKAFGFSTRRSPRAATGSTTRPTAPRSPSRTSPPTTRWL